MPRIDVRPRDSRNYCLVISHPLSIEPFPPHFPFSSSVKQKESENMNEREEVAEKKSEHESPPQPAFLYPLAFPWCVTCPLSYYLALKLFNPFNVPCHEQFVSFEASASREASCSGLSPRLRTEDSRSTGNMSLARWIFFAGFRTCTRERPNLREYGTD